MLSVRFGRTRTGSCTTAHYGQRALGRCKRIELQEAQVNQLSLRSAQAHRHAAQLSRARPHAQAYTVSAQD